MSRPIKYDYDELALPTSDVDTVLCDSWYYIGCYLAHEPSNLCWCDPLVIIDYENDEIIEIRHNGFH